MKKEFKYFIDSNIFLRVLTKDNEAKFKNSFAFLSLVKNGNIEGQTSNLVLAEVNWVLLKIYKFPKEKTLRGLNSITNLPNLKIVDNVNPQLAVRLYERQAVKFIDTLIASNMQAQLKEMIIVSYDKDFTKLNVVRKEPKDII